MAGNETNKQSQSNGTLAGLVAPRCVFATPPGPAHQSPGGGPPPRPAAAAALATERWTGAAAVAQPVPSRGRTLNATYAKKNGDRNTAKPGYLLS